MVRGGANHEWQLMCQLLFMTGLTNSALFVGFRPMLTSEPESVPTPAYRTVLYNTVQYCTVLYSTAQYCTVLLKNKKCVVNIAFGNEKKLRWVLSTRVLNFVGGITKIINNKHWSVFRRGVLKSQIQPQRSTHSPTEVKETLI